MTTTDFSDSADSEIVWPQLQSGAARMARAEPALAAFLQKTVTDCHSFSDSLASVLAGPIADATLGVATLRVMLTSIYAESPELAAFAATDLLAILARDPAEPDILTPFLYFKGFHALQTHRAGHWLWERGRRDLASFLQYRVSLLYGVDIHPAARLGKGIMFDHATGIVIGETAVVEDDVSMLHGVTLGGTGKEKGDRHPKVRRGVMIGAGATILGNIEIGHDASVAAGSVVLKSVPPRVTVAGVPAKTIGTPRSAVPAFEMDQTLPE